MAMVSPEALDMVRDFLNAKAGPAGRCPGVCGACPAACFQRPQNAEFGKVKVLTVNNLGEVPATFKGIIPFNLEPSIRTSRETSSICIKCKKPISNCTCSYSGVSTVDLPKAA